MLIHKPKANVLNFEKNHVLKLPISNQRRLFLHCAKCLKRIWIWVEQVQCSHQKLTNIIKRWQFFREGHWFIWIRFGQIVTKSELFMYRQHLLNLPWTWTCNSTSVGGGGGWNRKYKESITLSKCFQICYFNKLKIYILGTGILPGHCPKIRKSGTQTTNKHSCYNCVLVKFSICLKSILNWNSKQRFWRHNYLLKLSRGGNWKFHSP